MENNIHKLIQIHQLQTPINLKIITDIEFDNINKVLLFKDLLGNGFVCNNKECKLIKKEINSQENKENVKRWETIKIMAVFKDDIFLKKPIQIKTINVNFGFEKGNVILKLENLNPQYIAIPKDKDFAMHIISNHLDCLTNGTYGIKKQNIILAPEDKRNIISAISALVDRQNY